MTNTQTTLWRILNQLLQKLIQGGADNKGAAFKVNLDSKWAGTLGIRCNHVLLSAITKYIDVVISQVVVNDRLTWWEHTSIARCFEYQPLNGQKHNNAHKKTVYFTLRLPEEVLNRILDKWSDATFRDLFLLVNWLKEECSDGK